jgi:hypothetical protein
MMLVHIISIPAIVVQTVTPTETMTLRMCRSMTEEVVHNWPYAILSFVTCILYLFFNVM